MELAVKSTEHSLGPSGESAWLIAPLDGVLLATTQAGAALLGLPKEATEGPYSLDRSMPALGDILELSLSSTLARGAVAVRDLVFWTARGPLKLHCTCRQMDAASGTSAILVRLETKDEPHYPPSAMDTGATLSKIAERIRAGLRTRTVTTVSAASSTLPLLALSGEGPTRDPAASASIIPSQHLAQHLAKLAHELRTPVAAITAMAEIMRDERFGPLADVRYRDYARSIHDSSRHMLSVIENMLEGLSTDETGSGPAPALTFVELDVNALAAATVASLAPLAAKARLTIDTSLAERLPLIIADPRCVRQILLNLLTNAIKFTNPGGRLGVVTRHVSGGRLWLEVTDTGRGMASDELARVTRQGSCQNQAMSLRHESTGQGLGLPLVHALAAANGAHVEIASAPNEGTRASLIFPPDRIIPI